MKGFFSLIIFSINHPNITQETNSSLINHNQRQRDLKGKKDLNKQPTKPIITFSRPSETANMPSSNEFRSRKAGHQQLYNSKQQRTLKLGRTKDKSHRERSEYCKEATKLGHHAGRSGDKALTKERRAERNDNAPAETLADLSM